MEDETNIWQTLSPVQEGVTVLAEGINTILSRKSGAATPQWKEGGICLEYKLSFGIAPCPTWQSMGNYRNI